MPDLALFAPYTKERKKKRLRKKSRPHPEGTIQLVDMTGQYSFSDSKGPNEEHNNNDVVGCVFCG